MSQYQEEINQNSEQNELVDIQKLFSQLLKRWPWFIVMFFTAMTIAFVYNKFATPAYRASTTVLIKDDSGWRKTNDLVSSLDMFGTQTNLQNEIGIIQSYRLSHQTVESLGLHISYNKHGKYREKDIYKSCPFVIIADTSHIQAMNVEVNIMPVSKTHVRINVAAVEKMNSIIYSTGEVKPLNPGEDFNITQEVKFGELFETPYFSFIVVPTVEINQTAINTEYFIQFHDMVSVAKSFRSRLLVEPINKEASIVKISLVDNIPHRSIDFINALASNYVNLGLNEKNLTANRTIDFIDQQLTGITDSLTAIESNLETFRTQNQIVNMSEQGTSIYNKLQELEYKRSIQQMQIGYYNYLLDYVQNDSIANDLIAPSVIGIDDPLLTSLIVQLSQLYSTREQLRATSSSKNPYLRELNIQIATIQRSVVENVSNILANSKFILAEKQKEINKVQAELNKLPETERKLIGIERMFTVNDQIYTFLLQQRAEAAISRASSVADHKIVDTAMVDGRIRPKTSQNYLIAFVLGLILPAISIFIIDLFRNTIKDISDVEYLTKIPILGNVVHHESDEIGAHSVSNIVVESFRVIRTNLDFFITDGNVKVLSVSSMNPNEGKSFCSFYLAYVYALAGKKTIIIGADIRKPDTGIMFKANIKTGLSSFLSHRATWDEIVNQSIIDNLFFVAGGMVPPNPAELLSASNVQRILDHLQDYDIVIFDTSPVGIIADAAYILQRADVNLFVTRYEVSRKPNVKMVNNVVQKLKVKNPAIICNDFKRRRNKYYYYYYYSKMKVRGNEYYNYFDSKKE